MVQLVSVEALVRSPAQHSELRIWHCSRGGIGCSSGLGLIPYPSGTAEKEKKILPNLNNFAGWKAYPFPFPGYTGIKHFPASLIVVLGSCDLDFRHRKVGRMIWANSKQIYAQKPYAILFSLHDVVSMKAACWRWRCHSRSTGWLPESFPGEPPRRAINPH